MATDSIVTGLSLSAYKGSGQTIHQQIVRGYRVLLSPGRAHFRAGVSCLSGLCVSDYEYYIEQVYKTSNRPSLKAYGTDCFAF